MSDITRNAIATLREEMQNERTRAEAAEAELLELRMKHGALATVAKLLVENAHELGDHYQECRNCDVDRLRELLADEGGEWVEKAHCDTIEGELRDQLRDLRRVVDAWKAADKAMREIRFGTSDGKHSAKLTSDLEAAKEAMRHA